MKISFDKYTVWIIALSISAVVFGTLHFIRPSSRPIETTPSTALLKPDKPEVVAPERADDKDTAKALQVVRQVLAEFHVGSGLIHERGDRINVSIPKELHLLVFYEELAKRLEDADGSLQQMKEDRTKGRIEFDLYIDDKLGRHFILTRHSGLKNAGGKAAIIIDDFGYVYNDLVKELLFFNYPLTVSIIPGLEESKRVARDAGLANREILIHMPMEPEKEKFSDDGYTILSGMDAGAVRLRIRAAFSEIPSAIGMNNHQGSKVTAEPRIMKEVMTELFHEKKFFLDSRTSAASVAYETAKSMHLRCAVNQVFIDAEDDEDFIRSQMGKLEALAVRHGEVIGIAHMRKRTFRILQEMIPQLQGRGVTFVYISELL